MNPRRPSEFSIPITYYFKGIKLTCRVTAMSHLALGPDKKSRVKPRLAGRPPRMNSFTSPLIFFFYSFQ